MTSENEQRLWAAYKVSGDLSARDQLITEYMGFTERLAIECRASRAADSVDDAISEAYVALIECVDKFDPDRGLQFSTLARKRILGAIVDYVRRLVPGSRSQTPMVTVPMSGLDTEDSDLADALCSSSADPVMDGVMAREDNIALGKILASMPFSERCALLLRVFENVSHADLATGMGFSYHRATQLSTLVKKRLKRYHEYGPWPWRTVN